MNAKAKELVRANLVFYNLNKIAENKLGLSLVQYYLLSSIKEMPCCSPQQLAKQVGIHPSSLTQSLKRLRKKDAIFVAEDPKDSRKKIVSMTRNGAKMVERFGNGIESVLTNILDNGRFL